MAKLEQFLIIMIFQMLKSSFGSSAILKVENHCIRKSTQVTFFYQNAFVSEPNCLFAPMPK